MQSLVLLFQVLILCSKSIPYFVTYVNILNSWDDTGILTSWGVPTYSQYNEYNVIILTFWTSYEGATDALEPWVDPSRFFQLSTMQNITGLSNPTGDDFRKSIVKLYHSNGTKIMFSCFGASDKNPTNNDPIELAQKISQFVIDNEFDGVDIDYEDSESFSGSGLGEYWLTNFTIELRKNLPLNQYIITHAPQAPYFMGKSQYPLGSYLYIHTHIGMDIDWYNIQFYNQGTSKYSTYNTLFVTADGWSYNSSVYQMMNGHNDMNVKIPSNKIIVGKPASSYDASNTGFVDANTLESIFNTAVNTDTMGWNTGFMDWEFSTDQMHNFAFVNTVTKAWYK
eukprot:114761_1